MEARAGGREDAGDTGAGEWPHCAAIGGNCLAYEVGRIVGPEMASAMTDFIFAAREGARLVLQRNREGFTVQVTGEVQRGGRGTFDLAGVKELRRHLDRLTGGRGG